MKKLQIGIYSTEPAWLENSREILENYGENLKNNIEIHSFQNASEMWGGVKRKYLHILFVDIQNDDNSEIEIVKKVNREWPVCQVVYVSDGFHHVMDAYETKHIYYILKEKFEEKLPCIMDKAIRQLKVCGSKEMAFQCHGGVIVRLNLDEIMYFERNIRVTYIVTKNGRYVIDEKIREIEQKILSDDFMRCHTSFLVNFSYVKECMKKRLILEDGQIIDISRSYWGSVEKAYVQWGEKNIILVKSIKAQKA